MLRDVSRITPRRRPPKACPLGTGPAMLVLFALLGRATPAIAQWTDVTSGPLADPGRGYSVSWGDYDGDGDPDLCLATDMSFPTLRLLRNDGAGAFVDVTADPLTSNRNTLATVWGDADNDGDLDLFRVHFFDPKNIVYRNTGGTFTVAAELSNKGGMGGAAWGDYDLDGKLDLVFPDHGGLAWLYRNTGALSFTRETFFNEASRPVWVDYDGDGDLDLHLVAHQFDVLWRNNGGTLVLPNPLPAYDNDQRSGAAWGDYDNDGDPDYYLAKVVGTNRLFRNDGAGTFTDVTAGTPLGLAGDSQDASWVDFDNDGDLDLFVVRANSANLLFRNDGGVFVSNGASALDGTGARYSAAWADFDGDGDLDVYVTTDSTRARLLRNDLGPSHWLHVDLVGVNSNRSGIGARIRVKAGGIWSMRDVSGGDGLSQGSLTAEFGLGSSALADSVVVHWPSGLVTTRADVPGNRRIVLSEIATTGVEESPRLGATLGPPAPNPTRSGTRIRLEVAGTRRLRVEVLDLDGRSVRLIADREFAPGGYDLRWDGMDSNGRSAPAGLYIVRAGAGPDLLFQRLVRLR